MTYITIDTGKKQALQFLEYIKTLPFVKIHQEPNPVTLKAMEEVKKRKTRKHKNTKSLIISLSK